MTQLLFPWHVKPSLGQTVATVWEEVVGGLTPFESSFLLDALGGGALAVPIYRQLSLDFGPLSEWIWTTNSGRWVGWVAW